MYKNRSLSLFKLLMIAAFLPMGMMASDLRDIVNKVQNNEMIDSLGYVVQAQSKGRDATKRNMLPKVKANYMYQYMPDSSRSLFDVEQSGSVEASAVLFDGFRGFETIDAQENRIDATKETLEFQKEKFSLNAIELYFNMKTIISNMDARKQKAKQLENDLNRLERFYAVKSITEDKVEQVHAALAMTKYEIAFLKQNYQELALSLESLTGENVTSLDDCALVDKTVDNKESSHELNSLEHEIKALEHEAKVHTGEYWPTLILKDAYTSNQYYDSASSQNLSLPTNTNKIQLLASMTMFDFFTKSNERQVVEMQRQAKTSEYNFKKRDNELKKRFASTKLETIKAKISASEVSLEASKKSFEFIQKQHDANLVDTSVYLDSASQFYDAKSILESAKNEYQIALANYYFYNNVPLMEMIK